jgi:uncharacterized protein (TIGR02118 family)
MLAVTILYPQSDDTTFDMEYYTSTHMPMFAEAFGDGCKGWGAATVGDGTWIAMGWVMVDDKATFDKGLAARGAEIMGDIPNYTNAKPQMLVGEVAGGSQ